MLRKVAKRDQRSWGVTCWCSALLVALIGTSWPAETVQATLEQQQTQHTVSGVLSNLEPAAGKGMLTTDLGKPIFFRFERPDLFTRLSVGDRVTVQLDDEGRVLKVTEDLPAQIEKPPPSK